MDELKVKPDQLAKSGRLGDWHANLLRIDRYKCVLFTHDKTLVSLLVPGMRKAEFQTFTAVFHQQLFKLLNLEGLPQHQIAKMLNEYKSIKIGKTNNRSVLGSMNDLAFQAKYRIKVLGGLMSTDVAELNKALNRIPMSPLQCTYSIDELKSVLSELWP